MIYDVDINGKARRVEIKRDGTGYQVSVDGRRQTADVTVVGGVWSLILSDAGDDKADAKAAPSRRSYEIAIAEKAGGELTVHVNGRLVPATVAGGRGTWARRGHDAATGAGPQRVIAPMPGKVVKVLVKPGDTVAAKQGVVVVEAMKMENELRAPKAGTVTEVRVGEGTSVEAGAVLVVME